MSEPHKQPDLIDRELIPARSKVSYSREIGEAVITENIFGKAKVRIIRKEDELQRTLWTIGLVVCVGIAAVVAWQVWLAPLLAESVQEAALVETNAAQHAAEREPVASPVTAAPPVEPEAASAVAPHPVVVPQSAPRVVVPVRPPVASRPVIVRPQSAPQAASTLPPPAAAPQPPRVLPQTVQPPRVQPQTVPPKPAASAPAVATPVKPPVAASSPAAATAQPKPSPNESVLVADKPATEPTEPTNPTNPQNN